MEIWKFEAGYAGRTWMNLKKLIMNKCKALILSNLLLIAFHAAEAQVSFLGSEINSDFRRGMELYSKEKYPAALHFFDLYLKTGGDDFFSHREDAEFYGAMASLRLYYNDGEARMNRFINTHKGYDRLNDCYLALGDFFYQNKNYKKAASYYLQVNRLILSKDLLPSYCFRFGYSAYMKGDRTTALLMFSEIKDIDTEYTPPALYYYSHIAYEDKNYETAYQGFMRLRKDETFGPVVPFYLIQILYLRKDYDGILALAPELLKSAGPQRATEIYKFVGDAHYSKGNYKDAVPFLEKFISGSKIVSREDKYPLAYCYYKTGSYEKAIAIFLDLTATSDLMSQNIWCLLGDCYLHMNDKTRAQFAFGQASLLNYDKSLKEESLFNYAKLMYETSYSPFGEVIKAFQEYIDLYPGSDRISEVYDYLVTAYTQLKNYKAALESLDKIPNKDQRLEAAYQRVAFFRGLELVNNLELEQAVAMFEKSLKYEKYSRPLRARAVYWRGEAAYRLGQYDRAISDYQVFLGIPGASGLPEYDLVRYNLGYTLFNQKDYQGALNHFKAFEMSAPSSRPELLADTRNRIADCYFITTNYSSAISYYDKVIENGKVDPDYAMYQKGFSLGLGNDQKGKAEILSGLINKYPASKYIPGAIYERGRTYVVLKDSRKGESDFNNVIASFPSSPFVPKAIVQLGLLYFDMGENQKALEQFRKVIEKYPSTPEARYALTGMKNTYIEMNDVESYFTYMKGINGSNDINLSEKDSLLYSSGEKLYMKGNCEKASEIFKSYLTQFSNGNFRTNALYYLAECSMARGNKDEALEGYLEVGKASGNEFAEPSLETAATLYFEKEDYLKAYDCYTRLEKVTDKKDIIISAMKGELKSAYQAGDAEKTLAAAAHITGSPDIPDEMSREAVFMSAKAHYSLNQYDDALREFQKISGEITSVQGAESKYRVAELLDRKGATADAEKVIDEFIDKNTPHQYWMARVFLLLADISIRKGDLIQAKATLSGLKENYPVDSDGILDEVKSKLDSISTNQSSPADSTHVTGNKVPTQGK
ncbi:MAG TPA: tetratricopeptide repeat protein [Bacteroidales bacterium]|nr:tetratricopeptide repeat protein [Bacteroidales bacterium]